LLHLLKVCYQLDSTHTASIRQNTIILVPKLAHYYVNNFVELNCNCRSIGHDDVDDLQCLVVFFNTFC